MITTITIITKQKLILLMNKIKFLAFAIFYNYKNIILTSLSDVPQIEQHLHSIHCQRYFPTEIIIFAVNCRHVGWPKNIRSKLIMFNKIKCKKLLPERPQSEQEINISG